MLRKRYILEGVDGGVNKSVDVNEEGVDGGVNKPVDVNEEGVEVEMCEEDDNDEVEVGGNEDYVDNSGCDMVDEMDILDDGLYHLGNLYELFDEYNSCGAAIDKILQINQDHRFTVTKNCLHCGKLDKTELEQDREKLRLELEAVCEDRDNLRKSGDLLVFDLSTKLRQQEIRISELSGGESLRNEVKRLEKAKF